MYRLSLRSSASDGEDPHKQEDHHLGHVGQHVSRAPDGYARVLADVLLHVVLHGDATKGDSEDPGHVECLRCQVWQIGENQDDQWLNDSGVIKKSTELIKINIVTKEDHNIPCHKGTDVAGQNADENSTAGHNSKAPDALTHILRWHLVQPDFTKGLEHMIEDNSYPIIQKRFSEYDNVKNFIHFDFIKAK